LNSAMASSAAAAATAAAVARQQPHSQTIGRVSDNSLEQLLLQYRLFHLQCQSNSLTMAAAVAIQHVM
jgi:hypothetical protein